MALLLANATVTLRYNMRLIGAAGQRANISTPKPEQVDAAGGIIRYTVILDPGLSVPENTFITVDTYPANTALEGTILQAKDVVYDGEIPDLAITKIRGAVRVQP